MTTPDAARREVRDEAFEFIAARKGHFGTFDLVDALEPIILARNEAQAEVERLRTAIDTARQYCHRCEGNGRLYADGRAHYPSESVPTRDCPNCGGAGHTYDFTELEAIHSEAPAPEGGSPVKPVCGVAICWSRCGGWTVHRPAHLSEPYPSNATCGLAPLHDGDHAPKVQP